MLWEVLYLGSLLGRSWPLLSGDHMSLPALLALLEIVLGRWQWSAYMGVLGSSGVGLGTSGGHLGISLLHIVIAALHFICSLLIFIAYLCCVSLLLMLIAYFYCTFLLHICIAYLYCISLLPCCSLLSLASWGRCLVVWGVSWDDFRSFWTVRGVS